MSQGSHSLGRQAESSELLRICCPKCGNNVVECKSWKNGGTIFFKCKNNEEYENVERNGCGIKGERCMYVQSCHI
uniref:Uncharacterized protein n=1 Tax=Oryza punctata TaxID=4537 RepID=A0A0E0M097_ORYPU